MNSPLPIELIDHVFTRLTLTYGQAFLRQYEGVELAPVKTDWAMKLGVFGIVGDDNLVRVPAIDWALDNLTNPRPPNALEFRQLCRAYPAPEPAPSLPAPPRAVPERFKSAIAQLAVPLDDPRPEKVRVAYRFIAMWGTKGVRLSPLKQKTLKEMRAITREWEQRAAAAATQGTGHAIGQ